MANGRPAHGGEGGEDGEVEEDEIMTHRSEESWIVSVTWTDSAQGRPVTFHAYPCVSAATAKEALEIVRKLYPDAAIIGTPLNTRDLIA
jgi:hypothetical protein